MKRRDVLAAGVASSVALTGCVGGSDSDSDGSDDPVVAVSETGYDPRKLSVDVGTTVTWMNENSTAFQEHTVTSQGFLADSAEWSFDEELPEEGAEASYTFDAEGLYTYVGTVRGEDCMCGLVAVGDASYGDPLPCSPAMGGGGCSP